MILNFSHAKGLIFLFLIIFSNDLLARSWRVSQIPNGNVYSCKNCHNSSYGGSLNKFGLDVNSLVGRGSRSSFWDSTLAALDSDGDGASNGEELGDEDGDGVFSPPNSEVTNPGDSKSKPKTNDTISPVITLIGNSTLTLEAGSSYTELGSTATDSVDGNLTEQIKISGAVDPSKVGTYTLYYSVSDSSGNEAIKAIRKVTVTDTISPVITLIGNSTLTLEAGSSYTELGSTATDSVDGNLTEQIKISGIVEPSKVGTYTLYYSVVDSSGNEAAKAIRKVTVVDTISPVITLVGNSTLTLEAGSSYTELGATATDSLDGDLSDMIQVAGGVDEKKTGTYQLSYNVNDSSGNVAQPATRTVVIVDTTSPVITLAGDAIVTIKVGSNFEDIGATAQDIADGDLTSQIKVTGNFDANKAGEYQLKYTVTDSAGNAASEKIISIKVIKHTPTIAWDMPEALTYGTKLSEAQLNPASNAEGEFEFSHKQGELLPVGEHVLKADFYPSNQDKYLSASIEVRIRVDKAPLSISVESVSRLTNQKNPRFTISYEGFVSDETEDDLISLALATTEAKVDSEDGAYPIKLSGAKSNNYEIIYFNGVLTVIGKLKLTLEVRGSGEVRVNPDKVLFDMGEKVTLEAVPSKGYAFSAWEGLKSTSDNPVEVAITKDTTIKVDFVKLVIYTGIVVEGKGDILITPELDLYPAGSPIEVLAVPAKNYVFEKWTMKGYLLSKSNPLTTSKVLGSDIEIEAHFKYVKPAKPEVVKVYDIVNAPYGFVFNTEEGTNYEVQVSDDLLKWNQLREIKGTGEVFKFVDFRKAYYLQQFYRVRVVE